jgi:hypothetical protein
MEIGDREFGHFSIGLLLRESILRKNRIEFDFHAPLGIEELSHNDHRSRWTDFTEVFAVDAAYCFPVFGAGEIHAGADYVVQRRACAGEDFGGDLEDAVSLGYDIKIVCAYWTGAGDVDGAADAHGAGEANDGLVGRCTGKVLAHGFCSMRKV